MTTIAPDRPADFGSYWDGLDEELARWPAVPELEPLPLRSTDFATVSAVRLTSVGPYRIFGYYSVPKGAGPFPGLLLTPRYGSVNHIPDYNDRRRYAVLQIMHRGQRLADQPFAAEYPGLLTLGVDDPRTYIYRGIVADCLRAAEFLRSRPEVDNRRVGIIGDDLALITAARRSVFTALQPADLLLYRLIEARERVDAYPVEELNDYLRIYPDRREMVARTLALFDPLHHAAELSVPTGTGGRLSALLSVGDPGSLSGADWLGPLATALEGNERCSVDIYNVSHQGGTDQDWLDAWMARQLGTEPMSRFRRTA